MRKAPQVTCLYGSDEGQSDRLVMNRRHRSTDPILHKRVSHVVSATMFAMLLAGAIPSALAQAAPHTQRLNLGVMWLGSWGRMQRTYDFFERDAIAGREATGEFTLHDSGYSQGFAVGAGYRIKPRLGIGLEGSYQRRIDTPQNSMANKVDIRFGHRELFGLAVSGEYSHRPLDFGPRSGLFVQGTAGTYWVNDHMQAGPNIVNVRNAKQALFVTAALGYRVPIAGPVSLAFALYAGAEPALTAMTYGLRVGAGLQ